MARWRRRTDKYRHLTDSDATDDIDPTILRKLLDESRQSLFDVMPTNGATEVSSMSLPPRPECNSNTTLVSDECRPGKLRNILRGIENGSITSKAEVFAMTGRHLSYFRGELKRSKCEGKMQMLRQLDSLK